MTFSCWLKNELSLVLSISFVRKHLLRLGSVVEAFVWLSAVGSKMS